MGNRRREGQETTGDAFGAAQNVGRDTRLLPREHRAGAAEAGHHLIEDEKDTRALKTLSNGVQESGRHMRMPLAP